ncbi:MAG: BamA/TamA family outer membrane protein [Candidatus Aminicenantes bacterium]|nr:BamA/TamA family outer membrane protein [Candidatus Aminicenantes bacterium]
MEIKKIIFVLWVIVCLLTFASGMRANDDDSDQSHTQKVESAARRLIYSPIAFYSPETNLAYGAAGSLVFRISPGQGRNRPSSIGAVFIHTQRNQLQLAMTNDVYLNKAGLRILVKTAYLDYPDKFFGIGPQTRIDDEEIFTSRQFEFSLDVEKEVFAHFSMGARVQWDSWDLTEVVVGGQLENNNIPGIGSGQVAGMGLSASWDTRDRFYSPTRGSWLRLQADIFERVLGGDFAFSRFSLDARRYLRLFSNHVLALNGKVEMQAGDVPFQYLARFGGMYSMRGYFDGRFRDRDLVMAQMEYRMPLSRRWGVVAFGSAGTVAHRLNQLDLARPLLAGGVGLRFVFDKKEHIVLRMDLGFGKDSSGIYFSIYEAF